MNCQEICQANSDCQFFTYESTAAGQGNCILYDDQALDELFRTNWVK